MVDVRVWGDFACFTRPEHKVERVSYDVMTPSAARGVLEAICWKPEFRWRVREIHVLRPIRHYGLVRNEVNTPASERSARSWAKNGGGFLADGDRSQRYALVLRDVSYRIRADIELRDHARDPVAKYRDMFRRRVAKGQAFARPYLGTREFSAYFAPDDGEEPIDESDDLGRMLFDMQYDVTEDGAIRYWQHDEEGAQLVRGQARPTFFSARLDRGVLYVPEVPDAEANT